LWEDEKWTGRFLILENVAWKPVHTVTAGDIFKIQNVNLVQRAGVLGSPKRRQNRIRRFSMGTNNGDRLS
jgi:hypothetical protein